ncbi:MAG TPA: DUF3048 domain-containing protein [Jatrophihabitans sp.]|jgi:hypothetical protein
MKLSAPKFLTPLQPYLRNRKVQIGGAVVLVLAVAGTITGVALAGGNGKTAPAAITTSGPAPLPTTSAPTTSEAPVATTSPLTGGAPSNNGVVAVKIDDTGNGRPQMNIDKADIVYIEQVEGGLTRLLAVFNSQLPKVEAVRSTRDADPEILAQYGPIAYVASGGAPFPLQVLHSSPLKANIMDAGDPGFVRDNNRPAPYNVIGDLTEIAKATKAPKAKDIGLTFSADTAAAAAAPFAHTIHTQVGNTNVDFVFDTATKAYQRVIDGVPQTTADGKKIEAINVVVQFCKSDVDNRDVDVNGNPSQFTHTTGSGQVAVFRNGHELKGTWKRAADKDGTTLTGADGAPIALAPGNTWFALAATGNPLTVAK